MAIEFGPKDRYRTYGVPSLDLTFADKKSLVDRISGNNLVTFTRSTTATYVGSDGLIKTAAINEPRFDHNPLTRESLGLLVEEARANLVPYSGNLSSYLTDGLCSIQSNSTTTPDGTNSAVKIVENSGNVHQSRSGASVGGSAYYTLTVFLKAGERTRAAISMGAGNALVSINVNLLNGTYTTYANPSWWSNVVYDVTAFPNSWYKVRVTGYNSYSVTAIGVYPRNTAAAGPSDAAQNIYLGDGVSGFYCWGAQVEAGTFPTSYIPTTASTVTRAYDVASITGTNFSSWYNQSEGTLFQNCISRVPIGGPGGSNAGAGMIMVNSTTSDTIGFLRQSNSTALRVYVGTSAFWNIASQWPQNIASKAALAYKTDDFAVSANGLTVQTDTLGIVPTVTQLDIGQMSTAGYNRIGAGTFSRLTYYPTRLPDATLQELTKL